MPRFTIYNKSQVSLESVCEFSQNIIYYIIFEKAYFGWKQKDAVSVHVSLNANYLLLLPAPFSRIWLGLFS